jgi:hypothetical protein
LDPAGKAFCGVIVAAKLSRPTQAGLKQWLGAPFVTKASAEKVVSRF